MKIHQILLITALAFAMSSCSDSGDKATQEKTDTQEETNQAQSDNQATDDDAENESAENESTEEESSKDNVLTDYVKTPLDKAKAVEGVLQDSAEQQRQEIDEATEE